MTRVDSIALLSIYDLENSAVRALAPLLRQHGFQVAEIYFKDWKINTFTPPSEAEVAQLLRLLREREVGLVGVSVRATAYFEVAATLTRRIREETGAKVLWGGPHVTIRPEECLEQADFVCRGEGEYPSLELAQALNNGGDPTRIPNISGNWNGGRFRNPMRPLLQDIDALPFRDYTHPDKFYIEGGHVRRGDPMIPMPVYQVMTSRGCLNHCSYCFNTVLKDDVYVGLGRYYRRRSVENVIQELELARETFPKLIRIKFDDEMFVLQQDWVDELVEKYPKRVGLPFECLISPNALNVEALEKLKRAGLEIVYMGIENTERVCHDLYDRPFSNRKVLDCARVLHCLGLDIRYHLIIDNPQTTTEDKEELLDHLLRIPRPFELYLFSLTVFPETGLARKLLRRGVITERDLEELRTKVHRQWRASLSFPRSAEDRFWAALFVLVSKVFVPKAFIRSLSRRRWLRRHPKPLVLFAHACNLFKLTLVFIYMVYIGEMTWSLLRRWLNPRSFVSQ